MRAILDYGQATFAGDVRNRIHVARQPVKMRGNDCNGPGTYRSFDQSRIDVEGVRIDVDENRLEAAHSSDFRYNPEGQRRKNNFRAGGKLEGFQNVVKRHPSVGRTDSMRHTAIFREAFFKHRNLRSLHPASAAKRFERCVCRTWNVTHAITGYRPNHSILPSEFCDPKKAISFASCFRRA